jgi:hypothetical protein
MKSANAHLFYELWGLNGVRKTKMIKINIILTYLDAEKAWDIPCLSLKGLRRLRKQFSSFRMVTLCPVSFLGANCGTGANHLFLK